MDHATYYAQLEEGARYLAARASDEEARIEHLGFANHYYRLRIGAASVPILMAISAQAAKTGPVTDGATARRS